MGWLDVHLGHVKLARYADKFQAWEESASEGVKSNCTVRKLTPEENAALPELFAKDTYWKYNRSKGGRIMGIGSMEEVREHRRRKKRKEVKKDA